MVAPDLNVLIIGSDSQVRNATVTYRENERRVASAIQPSSGQFVRSGDGTRLARA
jgi:hypothetical protein